jgi:hypothetical protein
MDLESWIVALLQDIQTAAEKGENYDLHLEFPIVEEITEAYHNTKWIEIY